MNEKAIRTLSFQNILDRMKNYAGSEMEKERIDQLRPSADPEWIQKSLDQTDEAVRIIYKWGRAPLYGIMPLDIALERIAKGGYLRPETLLDVSKFLRSAREMKSFMKTDEESYQDFPYISQLLDQISVFFSLEKKIERAIISSEEISDEASVQLKAIRRNKQAKQQRIRDKLSEITKSKSHLLQDAIVTIRDGRFVVPVKSENKQFLDGIVHDRSGSGQTVYIEPIAVVELNNDLRILEAEEEQEIIRILKQFSQEIYRDKDDLILNQTVLSDLAFIFQKAHLAIELNASKPKLSERGSFNLKQARHPLIDPKKIVPIDIYLGCDYNTLVITGPNTGGKTVSLKTVGLLHLMAQSGLHIPAAEGSEIGVFKEIFADIGDEQSIEQSLSTFSAHMKNIVDILSEVDQGDLVLFDELGAGTDPVEGAALAMAILKSLKDSNIPTIATTHYSQLKLFAINEDGVKNGAVAFDIETLSPTYRLEIGVPGKSNAFEISKRLGLSSHLIEKAKRLTSDDNRAFEDILQNIEQDRKKMRAASEEAEQRLSEITLLERRLHSELESTRQRKETILQDAQDEAYRILRDAKKDAQDLIKELRYMKREGRNVTQKLDSLEQEYNKKIDRHTTVLGNEGEQRTHKAFHAGDDVQIVDLGEVGTILTEPNNKGEVQVEVGIMKFTCPVANLEHVTSEMSKAADRQMKKIIKSKKDMNISTSLDLRGENIIDATMLLDKYLDDCSIAGLKSVTIIHGKGTGALRTGITAFLKKDSRVSQFRFGQHNEGGTGASIVELK